MELELLRIRPPRDRLDLSAVLRVSAERSPSTGRAYGIQRVCHAWQIPRSTFYAWRMRVRLGIALRPRGRPRKPGHAENPGHTLIP